MGKKSKLENLEKQIKYHLSDILLTEVNDIRIKDFSINYVKLSTDFSHAKIYINYFDKEKEKIYFKAFANVVPFFKTELSKRLEIKKIPTLEFIVDDSMEKLENINTLIENERK